MEYLALQFVQLIFEGGQMLKWLKPQKNLLSINITFRFKNDQGTPHQASEMQYLTIAYEWIYDENNSASTVCDQYGVTYVRPEKDWKNYSIVFF